MNPKTVLIAAALACASLSAPALRAAEEPAVSKLDPRAFEQVKSQIEEQLYNNERYKEISDEDRQRVLQALDRMAETLDGVGNVQDLNIDARTRLLNDQALVNTVLTQAAEDSRLICSREQKVGTRFKTTVCETVAERRARNEAAQRAMQNRGRSTMTPVPGG